MSRAAKLAGLGATVVVAAAVIVVLAVRLPSDGGGRLVIGDTVAADLAALADDTFGQFLAAAPATADCIGQPKLEAVPDLDDPARYDQAAQVIYIRVPATAPNLNASLIHEFAHHLEIACTSQNGIRAAFLAAQGHPPETDWFADVGWAERPSEQFAEAVVEAVLGRRSRNQLQLRLTPEAVRVVNIWLTTND